VKFLFLWYGIEATISFECHAEFVTITTILDLSRGLTTEQRAELKSKHATDFLELYNDLKRIAEKTFPAKEIALDRRAAASAPPGAAVPSQLAELHERLYRKIWAKFTERILSPLRGHSAVLGDTIADFRGLILGVNHGLRNGSTVRSLSPIAPPYSRSSVDTELSPDRVVRGITPGDPGFEAIWAIVNQDRDDETEITASQFLEGRVFYATALGHQSGLVEATKNDPLFYLVYENTENIWQLGRVISRLHAAGTARTAAIMHFETLRKVGSVLLRAGTQLDDALSSPFSLEDHSEENIKLARENDRDHLTDVEAPFRELVTINVDGPIYARIERSRNYVSSFRSLAEGLRVKRIEGYQPYDEFVQQKLGAAFEYINRLGRRYVQVQRDRIVLSRRLQGLDALYEEKVISAAQVGADFALLCVLLPYYAASISEKLAPSSVHLSLWAGWAAFGLTNFVFLVIKQRWPDNHFVKRYRNRFLVAGLVLGLAMASVYLARWETPGQLSETTKDEAISTTAQSQPRALPQQK
jgi:hypothetical protein